MRTTLISGASGLIGSALVAHLRGRGERVVTLVRRQPRAEDEIRWDPRGGDLPADAMKGADVVVNLSGAGIGDRRWTESRKEEILNSRLQTTGLLAKAIAAAERPPPVFLSASAIGIYGQDRGDELLEEDSATGDDFLARVTVEWEAATAPAEAAGTRVVLFRTGLVLTGSGGLLGPLLPLFKIGLGGKIGSGNQWMSWISIDDEVGALVHLMDSSVSGPVNLVAPHPATNAEFTNALAKTLGRPAFLRIPRLALYVRLGREMAEGTALSSQRVRSDRLSSAGFEFFHSDLETALRQVLDH